MIWVVDSVFQASLDSRTYTSKERAANQSPFVVVMHASEEVSMIGHAGVLILLLLWCNINFQIGLHMFFDYFQSSIVIGIVDMLKRSRIPKTLYLFLLRVNFFLKDKNPVSLLVCRVVCVSDGLCNIERLYCSNKL